jgi:hypothetical protein
MACVAQTVAGDKTDKDLRLREWRLRVKTVGLNGFAVAGCVDWRGGTIEVAFESR